MRIMCTIDGVPVHLNGGLSQRYQVGVAAMNCDVHDVLYQVRDKQHEEGSNGDKDRARQHKYVREDATAKNGHLGHVDVLERGLRSGL